MTDYEKARAECKEAFRKENSGIITRSEEQAIDYAFLEAYRYGRWAAMEEAKASPDVNHIPDAGKMIRLTTATQIMAGLLASDRPTRHPVKRSIELTDALLAELDKTKEK